MAVQPWRKVIERKEYRSLSDDEKLEVRNEYFDAVVAPQVPVEQVDSVREIFYNDVKRFAIEDAKPGFVKSYIGNALKAASRTGGVVVGTMSSPLAFQWGAQSAQFLDEKAFNKMSVVEQSLVRIGGGFMSAWESATQKGKWGSRWGDYFKGVTGKTIEESLPPKMKWLAPTFEFMGDLVSDPIILFGEASRIASLRLPKNFMKEAPKAIVDDLAKLEKADLAQKQAVRGKLIEILNNRKGYIDWWKTQVKRMDEVAAGKGPPLMKPGERQFKDLTAPQSAVSGQPKREFADIIGRETPELTQKIEEAVMLGKYKPTSPDKVIAGRKIDTYRKQKGIEPLKRTDKESLRKYNQQQTLNKINEFRTKKGLTPFTKLQATGGLILGIEEDENGNLSYNIPKGLAGTTGVVVGASVFNVGKHKLFTETLSKNPAWAKVHGMIGKQGKSFTFSGLMSRLNINLLDRFAELQKKSLKTYEAARTFSVFRDDAEFKFKELRTALKPVRNDEVIFTDYVDAHRALTRAQRGLENPNKVGLDDAKQAIAEIESHYAASGKDVGELRASLDLFQKWTHDYILKEALDSGVISQESYNAVRKNNQWYATFEILDHLPPDMDKIPSLPSKEYFSVANQEVIKSMTGTDKLISNPIEATLRKFTRAQATFARNKVASVLVDDPVSKEFLRPVASSKKEFAIMKNSKLNPVAEGAWDAKEFGTISRFKDGRIEKYLAPKAIADAMKQLTPKQAPRFIQALNQVFRASATTMYLPFTISNAMRDMLMAYTTAPVNKNPAKFGIDWVKGFWEGAKHEFLGASDIAEQYIKSGGGFGYTGELRQAKLAQHELFKKGYPRMAFDVVASPFRLIEKISATTELAPRLATFSRAQYTGLKAKDAAMMARESTIDFNRGGVWTKILNQFVPFLNARVQGRVTVGKALGVGEYGKKALSLLPKQAKYNIAPGTHKKAAQTLARIGAATVIPGMSLYAWNRMYYSDLYDDIPEYIKQNYFTFITGTDVDKRGKTVPKFFVISKGDVGQMAFNPIELGLDKMWEKDTESTKAFLVNYLSDLSPIEFARKGEFSLSKAAGGLLPPVVKGAVEDWANLKFYTGTEVVPYYTGKTKPPELQYKESTPKTYKWLGKKLKVSPLRLQNFASNLLAGYGREGLSPESMVRGLTGRLVKSVGGEKEQQAWTAIKDIEQGFVYTRAYAEELIKNGERDAGMSLVRDWNATLSQRIANYNDEFERHGLREKGGISNSYRFTIARIRNMFKNIQSRKRFTPLERRLLRRVR